jgi:hypothetical protein
MPSGGRRAVPRTESTYDGLDGGAWLQTLVLPLLLFVTAVAVVSALVLSGAVQGHKTYGPPADGPTTQPTILIEP